MLSQHALQVVSQHALQQVSGGGGSAPGGCLVLGVPGLGVCSGGGALWGVPGGDPPRTATAVGGMHPTGMHSC